MTGNILRDKVSHEFTTSKDVERTIELLATMKSNQRTAKQVSELIKIVKQMKFFQD